MTSTLGENHGSSRFADGDALSTARTSAEMAAVSADSATYDMARRVIFAGSVEDV